MHFQLNGHSTMQSKPVIDVHNAITLHDQTLTSHYDSEHASAIDISSDNILSKSNVINKLTIILLFVGLIFFTIRFVAVRWQRLFKTLITSYYNLLCPALRAPPQLD